MRSRGLRPMPRFLAVVGTRKEGARGEFGICWVWRAWGQLGVQVWRGQGWRCASMSLQAQYLLPERDSPIVSGLPSCRPHLSTSVTLFGASLCAWASLRTVGGQEMTSLMVNDEEGPPSPSHVSSSSEMLHSPLPCTACKPSGDTPDVFISYRRNSGSQLAR